MVLEPASYLGAVHKLRHRGWRIQESILRVAAPRKLPTYRGESGRFAYLYGAAPTAAPLAPGGGGGGDAPVGGSGR